MLCIRDWSLLTTVVLCTMFLGQPSCSKRQHSDITDFKTWQQSLQNRSHSKAAFLDPLLSSDSDGPLKNDIPRQLFNHQSRASGHQQPAVTGYQQHPNPGYQQFSNQGFQQYPSVGFNQFPSSGFQQLPNPAFQQYQKAGFPENQNFGFPPLPNADSPEPPSTAAPQIYKMDNLVIIANPPQNQQEPCVSDRLPPPNFPNPHRSSDSDSKNPGGKDHNCVWAVVTCCSPKDFVERHNCFELLGCPGSLFDGPPCDPDKIMAAADTAAEYYRNEYNHTSETTTENGV